MITLAINTASRTTTIALIKDGSLLRSKSWPCQNNEGETLIPAIEQLLKPLTYQNLNNILVINGPGSFTGLRVGVTAANTIAYLTKKNLYSLTTFQLHHANTTLSVLVFAGRGAVYLSQPEQQPLIVKLTEINQLLQQKQITKTSGEITLEQQSQIQAAYSPSTLNPAQQILNAWQKHSKHLKPQTIIKPNYVKDAGVHIKK